MSETKKPVRVNWWQEKRRLIEAGQRERDRAQAIIAIAARAGCSAVSWGMLLKNNVPDEIAIAEAVKAVHKGAEDAGAMT